MQIRIHTTFLGLCSFIKDSNYLIYFKCWKATLSCEGFSFASIASWPASAKGVDGMRRAFLWNDAATEQPGNAGKTCALWCQGLGLRTCSLPWGVTWLSPGHSSAPALGRGQGGSTGTSWKKVRFNYCRWRNQSLLIYIKNIRLVLDKYIVVLLLIFFIVSVISVIFY